MEGFLILVLVVSVVVMLSRYLRRREIEAFRDADMSALQSFNELREKSGKTPVEIPDEALLARAAQLTVKQEARLEVELRDGLFDELHRRFLFELDRALVQQLKIFVLVPMNSIVRSDAQMQNRLSQKTIPFVVCDPRNLHIIAGIQLKAAGIDAQSDHELKVRIFEQIGIPLLTFPTISGISATEILDQLGPVLRDQEIGCPACGGEMNVRKVARGKSAKGKSAGQTFKVCRRYPECKGRILISQSQN